jgi:hypothetical protein
MALWLSGGSGVQVPLPTGTALVLSGGAGVQILSPPIPARTVAAEEAGTAFFLPDLYEYLPEIVRSADATLVDRGQVPVYLWDSVPEWDVTPYRWDELIGPEPILRTTVRIMQLELETTAKEIRDLVRLFNVDRAPRVFLPYLADYLGTVLPSSSELQQRTFLNNLVDVYRRKGTPLVFQQLFASLGFDVELVEKYHRKGDGVLVGGPQITKAATHIARTERVGSVTIGLAGPYVFSLARPPAIPSSVVVRLFAQSTADPTIVQDDGNGAWLAGVLGSVNYRTGQCSITLLAAPVVAGFIEARYAFFPDRFPDPFGDRWTDRTRSSFAATTLIPKDSTVQVTQEVANRLALYLELLRPAHIVFEDATVLSILEDEVVLDDELNPLAFLFYEPMSAMAFGYGYHATENASLATIRDGQEYLKDYTQPVDDPTYVFPWNMDGQFDNAAVHAETEYLGQSSLEHYDTTVTADSARTTTSFSVSDTGALPAGIQAGTSYLVVVDGPAGGQSALIDSITDQGAYLDITLDGGTPLSVAPETGDAIVLLDEDALRFDQLDLVPQDSLQGLWREAVYNGDDVTLAFSGSTLGKLPVQASTVTMYFTIATVDYTETDDGAGNFTNVNGKISSASITYATGAVAVTFVGGEEPDSTTTIDYQYASASTSSMGEF